MLRKSMKHGIAAAVAVALALTGSATTAHAAVDDMDAVSLAKRYVGYEYTSGGSAPSKGFNASGLIYYVYDVLGYDLPRALDAQYKSGKRVSSISSLEYGDLLFFGKTGDPSYAGIYTGGGTFVMASQSRDQVVTRKLSDYKSNYIGARRVLTEEDHDRAAALLIGEKYLGTPYVFGARYGQTQTFDCSSFVKTVYNALGIDLPRVSRNQALEGTYVKRSNLQAGDLVFFTTEDSGGRIGHVGIYAGNGQMLHTYGEGGVKYSTIETGWWDNHYVTARRVIQ